MVIVSQDKRIINFNRVENIDYVNNDAQKEFIEESNLDILTPLIKKTTRIDLAKLKGYGIYAYFPDGRNIMIGQYDTEKRAKEVLQEIVSKYNTHGGFCDAVRGRLIALHGTPVVYEMPEE